MYATQLATDTLAEHADGGSHLSVTRISGIVLPRALITIRVRSPHCEAFDMGEVVKRWDDSASLMTQGSGALVHGLLDYVVDGHFDTIQSLDDALEGLEETLFAERRTGSEFVRTTYAIRKDLVSLRRVVLPMREVVNALMRHRGRTGGPERLVPCATSVTGATIPSPRPACTSRGAQGIPGRRGPAGATRGPTTRNRPNVRW